MKNYFLIIIFMMFAAQIYGEEELRENLPDNLLIYREMQQFIGSIDCYNLVPLTGGLSDNTLYKCTVDGTHYVVRILKDLPEMRYLNIAIHCLMGEKNIGPKVYYYNHYDDFSFFVTEFIDTHTLFFEQANDRMILDCVAQKAKSIAELEVRMKTINKETMFDETIRRYEHMKEKNVVVFDDLLKEMKDKAEDLRKLLENEQRPLIINHNDFHQRNMFFFNNDIVVIDWDTIALSYEFSDLTCYSVCACLSDADDLYLLEQYLQRAPSVADEHYFRLVKLLMRVLIVVGCLDFANYVPENLLMDDIKDFNYYAEIFWHDMKCDSPEFFYKWGMSQLRELHQEYENFNIQ